MLISEQPLDTVWLKQAKIKTVILKGFFIADLSWNIAFKFPTFLLA